MWQRGQIAETISASSEVSRPQAGLAAGRRVEPVCPTNRRHPDATVQAGRPEEIREGGTAGARVGGADVPRGGARAGGGVGTSEATTPPPGGGGGGTAGAAPPHAVGGTQLGRP